MNLSFFLFFLISELSVPVLQQMNAEHRSKDFLHLEPIFIALFWPLPMESQCPRVEKNIVANLQ